MYKQIIIILLVLSYNFNKSQQLVYRNDTIIGKLHQNAVIKCDDCYNYSEENILRKAILLKLPVEITCDNKNNCNYELIYNYELSRIDSKRAIIKFNSYSNGDSYWLYLKNIDQNIYIYKKILYKNGIYKKRIKSNDYDYLPATEVCFENLNIKVVKYISFEDHFNSVVFKNCYKCPIQVKVENCIKNQRINYKW